MLIRKLICTKNSHYFRKVKSLTKFGMFIIEYDTEVSMINNKKEIYTVDEMFECICNHRQSYLRNKKIDTILK